MHTYFIEGKSYIDRKPVVEQLRNFTKNRIWMLENFFWVKQKSGKKWKQNLISLSETTEILPEINLASCTKHTPTSFYGLTNTKLNGLVEKINST